MSQPKKSSLLKDDWRFLAFALFLGLAIRLDFLAANKFVIDSDEAIVGLMAIDIKDGMGVPTFYYGQHYMGSLEPLIVAGGFAVFGVSDVVLKAVPLLFSLALIVLVYLLAYEIAGRIGARVAALLCAVPPVPLVIWSGMARGGFIEIVVIGALALLLTIRWIKAAQPPARYTGLIAAVLGLGWWVNNQIIYFILPIGVMILARLLVEEWRGKRVFPRNAVIAHIIAGMLGFLVGGFPFWEYNFRNHWASFGIFHSAGAHEVGKHFAGLFGVSLPMLFGGMRFWNEEDIYPFASTIVLLVYGLVLLLVLRARGSWITRLLKLKIDRDQPVELFLLFGLSCLLIFPLSSFGWLVEAPRYLLPLYVAVFVLSGFAAAIIAVVRPFLAIPFAGLLLALNLASCYWGGRAVPGEPIVPGEQGVFRGERVSKNQDDLLDWLFDHHVDIVRTNYWIGYRLAFESEGTIRFAHFGKPETVRIPAWEEEAAATNPKEMPFVLLPSQAVAVRKAFETLGYRYQEAQASGYLIFYNVEPAQSDLKPIAPSRFTVSASDNNETAQSAVDGDEYTRWGTGRPQVPGMRFTVRFKEPTAIRGLSYLMGQWGVSDYPRGLAIEAELANGTHRTMLSFADHEAISYFCREAVGHEFDFFWAPFKVREVTLTETAEAKIFDWSIAELRLYE